MEIFFKKLKDSIRLEVVDNELRTTYILGNYEQLKNTINEILHSWEIDQEL